ncbi:ABC transporter ATP-binding protein, partial [Paenibacillus sp. AR247]|uniref:ABC transporter ATP-binding protein n=1 Tax=Paenibacillus sp. AR247 TaxID=1631599 RepID=UPI000CF8B4CC
MNLVQIEKQFEGQVVVHPLSLNIEEGEFLTLLGPSGCGKTTILRMIAGFEQPTHGEIILEGQNVTKLPPNQRDLNLVFQHYALFPHMTVGDNIAFGLKMKKLPQAEQKARVAEAVQMTQLTALTSRYPHQLSGGQQQRVAIARAIANKPKVLLLDEPLGALDLQLRKSLQSELKHLQRSLGITFVYVTHDQEEAMMLSDRIVIMNSGKVEQIGTPKDIYAAPKTLFAATFVGENNIFSSGSELFAVR